MKTESKKSSPPANLLGQQQKGHTALGHPEKLKRSCTKLPNMQDRPSQHTEHPHHHWPHHPDHEHGKPNLPLAVPGHTVDSHDAVLLHPGPQTVQLHPELPLAELVNNVPVLECSPGNAEPPEAPSSLSMSTLMQNPYMLFLF